LAANRPTFSGLSAAEVAQRVARGQSNDYEARVGRTYWEIVRDNVFNLFNIVLSVLLIILLVFREYTAFFFAGFSVISNSFLGMIQEINAKRKLDSLAALSAQEVKVWRDGKLITVPQKQLVIDDMLPIEPGDRLVVDGRVAHSDALEMDESQLTGESDAVHKDAGNDLVSGSFVVAGTGVMQVTKVGKESTINRLSTVAKAYKNVKTPTQVRIDAIVQLSVIAMFILVPMLFIQSYRLDQPFLEIVKNSVVFVTSLVPQGLVLLAVLSLTIGAIRITRHQTLIQRVNAVESLANVTVLCFDKTGTLTRNELTVTEVLSPDGVSPDKVQAYLRAYTGSLSHLNRTAGAIDTYIQSNPNGASAAQPQKIREIPFTSARKWGAIEFSDETLILGAPERVLDPNSELARRASELAAGGLRVLAFARTTEPPTDTHLGNAAQPLALIVMGDKVRDDIRETLQAFSEQGVKLKVISGDNVETVRAIAAEAGMQVEQAYTGDQLVAMSDGELSAAAMRGTVFARIEPDTKRRLIMALKEQGEYVAMVGDGVNDVPALKAADLAIVMNDGAQIAKDIGDIVLLNNAMSTLPMAFHEGRSITQTIYGTTKLFLTRNAYWVFLFVFVGFLTLPFPITPVQISFLTFGTVNMPATFIAFELWRPSKMERFRRDVLDYILISGVIGAVAMTLLYVCAYMVTFGNLDATRSAITVFGCFYGWLVLYGVHGIDMLRLKTYRQQRSVAFFAPLFSALTILALYLLPGLFEFVAPTMPLIYLITSIFLLSAVVLDLGLHDRRFVNNLWRFVAP